MYQTIKPIVDITTLVNIYSLPFTDQVEEYTLLRTTFYCFCFKKVMRRRAFRSRHNRLHSSFRHRRNTPGLADPNSTTTRDPSPYHTLPGTDVETTAIREQLESARRNSQFRHSSQMARLGVALFGIHTVGVHMMAFCRTLTRRRGETVDPALGGWQVDVS